MTTAAIFARYGERYFRELESALLQQFSTTGNTIIATGGGTPCHGTNMAMMLKHGTVVYLDASNETIVRRIALAPGQRPLIDDAHPAAVNSYITSTRAAREPVYLTAHLVINADRLETEQEIADTVSQLTHILSLPNNCS